MLAVGCGVSRLALGAKASSRGGHVPRHNTSYHGIFCAAEGGRLALSEATTYYLLVYLDYIATSNVA